MSAGEYTYLATEIRWEEAPGHKPGDRLVTSDVPGWPVAAFSRKYELQNWIDKLQASSVSLPVLPYAQRASLRRSGAYARR
jgi:hypothetical protein